jgi:hypothetical protein
MARTFTVQTWEPEWVPYTWVVEVDDDSLSDEEAKEAAKSLEKVVLVTRTPFVGNTDIEGSLEREIQSVEEGNALWEQLEEEGLVLNID